MVFWAETLLDTIVGESPIMVLVLDRTFYVGTMEGENQSKVFLGDTLLDIMVGENPIMVLVLDRSF